MASKGPDFPAGLDEWLLKQVCNRVGAQKALDRNLLPDQARIEFPGVTDSQIRLAIEALRDRGIMLVNLYDGRGYFIAETKEEYDDFRRRYVAIAMTILGRIHRMDITAKRRFDYNPLQMTLMEIR